jgi:hypothetical protein
MVRLVSLGSRLPTRLSMPSCSQPSRTLRAADAVARRRAILDRRCARRHGPRAGRAEGWCRSNKRIGQDDVVPQDFPLPLPARPIVFGKRKRHYFCDHHLSLVADRDKSGFVLFRFAHHIARAKCSLTILDLLVCSCVQQFCGHLRRWKQIENHLESRSENGANPVKNHGQAHKHGCRPV